MSSAAPKRTTRSVAHRLDWSAVADGLGQLGVALTAPVLSVAECRALRGPYDDEGRFRSSVDMARHRFGEG